MRVSGRIIDAQPFLRGVLRIILPGMLRHRGDVLKQKHSTVSRAFLFIRQFHPARILDELSFYILETFLVKNY